MLVFYMTESDSHTQGTREQLIWLNKVKDKRDADALAFARCQPLESSGFVCDRDKSINRRKVEGDRRRGQPGASP